MASHLAIVLPGAGYGAHGPALHLPRLALEEAGAETAVVEYPTIPRGLPEAGERWDGFYGSVAEQVAAIVAGAETERVTFLAKSLGTMALAALPAGTTGKARVDAVWLTPLFGVELVRAGAIKQAWPSLLVAGGADGAHDRAGHEHVRAALIAPSLVLAGADHALEVPGDVRATLDGLRALIEAVAAFAALGWEETAPR
jgi:hypothetical protein